MNLNDFLRKTPLYSQWLRIKTRSHHGINIPLGALKSEQSCGIGEYLDLYLLIDFCKTCGFDLIQLLPLNDSGDDPSPYNALSSYALHPIYLSLSSLPYLEKHPYLHEELASLMGLNLSERIEYASVLEKKMLFLKHYFDLTKEYFYQNSTYQQFVKEHEWLEEYVFYKSIKHAISFKSWQEWPEELRELNEGVREKLRTELLEWNNFYKILQFLCFSQLEAVKAYAEKNDLFLMGDIPILISPDSADVWAEREFFDMNDSVGFPPDVYSKEGQLWGFPALRWDVLAACDYRWWKRRLAVASRLYHLYRIDHVAGFYRLWLIERGKEPKDGRFFPHELKTCIKQGHEHLSRIISFSPMLPIAEDLGLIPHEMSQSLRSLGIAGTKVMRWERNWGHDQTFTIVEEYPILSMSCVSTHDSATLQLWWEEFPEEAKEYCKEKGWEYSVDLKIEQRKSILKDAHRSHSLFHINLLGEYLAIDPNLCHKDPKDERINVPGVMSSKNWTYKIQVTLEEISKHSSLITWMQSLTSEKDLEN